MWRQRKTARLCIKTVYVAICTERVEAKAICARESSVAHVAICTERVEAKAISVYRFVCVESCNLHGACGGKAHGTNLPDAFLQLQSARSVWRQRGMRPLRERQQLVAICTERVEAKVPLLHDFFGCRVVAICTERVEAKAYSGTIGSAL